MRLLCCVLDCGQPAFDQCAWSGNSRMCFEHWDAAVWEASRALGRRIARRLRMTADNGHSHELPEQAPEGR